jgi:hypothetical protein
MQIANKKSRLIKGGINNLQLSNSITEGNFVL